MLWTVTKKVNNASVPKAPRATRRTLLFPFQSTLARAIPRKQIADETRQRKKTISIAGIRLSCFTNTFMIENASVASSMFTTAALTTLVLAEDSAALIARRTCRHRRARQYADLSAFEIRRWTLGVRRFPLLLRYDP